MMNEFQRRILAEAAKYGGKVASQNHNMARMVNEAPAMSPSVVSTMFGYSKPQFEAKMRQLIQKMGFEKGITKMEIVNNKMVLHFANAAKARDFVITFNGLTKRSSKGSAATINTSFDKTKAPAGTNAVVSVDFGMLKTEGLDRESHLFLMLESLHEQYIAEGGVKAAIEDFMYDMLPKQAIAELKPIMKNQSIRGADLRNKVTAVLKKHKVPLMHIGGSSAQLVIDYFDTFHGESVEEVQDEISEGVRMMAGVEKMLKDEGHPTMVNSLRKIRKSLEGKPTGSVMVITKEKSPESMEIKIYEPSDFASMAKGLTKKAEPKVGSKGSWSGGEVTVVAIKEETEAEAYAPLDTPGIIGAFTEATKKKRFEYRLSQNSWGKSHGLPHEVCVSDRKAEWRSANVKGTVCYIAVDEGEEGKPVLEKWAIRNHVKYVKAESVEVEVDEAFNPADHGFRIDKDGDKFIVYKLSMNQGSIRFPDGRKGTVIGRYGTKDEALAAAKRNAGVKEEAEVAEAKEKFLTGPGKRDPKRLIGIYTTTGKWVKDVGSENEAKALVNKSWGESVEMQEQDRVPVQGSKMVYVGQSLRALQDKNMFSGSVVKGERYKVATNAKGKVDLVHQAVGYRTAVRNVDATTIEALIKDKVLT